jgi:hypothetical protein
LVKGEGVSVHIAAKENRAILAFAHALETHNILVEVLRLGDVADVQLDVPELAIPNHP